MQNEYLLLKIDFQSGNFVLNDFWKQKMYFLTLDKIFILDNFSFVQDKKYFVRAEGRGISPESILSMSIDKPKLSWFKFSRLRLIHLVQVSISKQS